MSRWPRFVVVLSLAAGLLEAQGLGELAAKEKRRREEEQKKNKGPARVVTTEDLEKVEAATATAPARPLAQELGAKADPAGRKRGHQEGLPETEEPADPRAEPQDERTWRQQAAELRKALLDAENKLKEIDQEKNRMSGQVMLSTDSNEILRLRGQLDDIEQKLTNARQALADAKHNLVELEDSARRAGVPPGWIR